MRKVSFRIRRQYFDKIVSGEKNVELRAYTPFWFNRLIRNGKPDVAVFVCGKEVHRRRITGVHIEIPEKFLERPLSLQGLGDLFGDLNLMASESCIVVELGEVYEEEEP
jgi:hypothetical protein